MTVVEANGAPWQELRAAVDEAGNRLTPRGAVWEARISERGLPLVRVRIGDRWWNLLFKIAAWAGGRRAAYEAVASAWLPRKKISETQEPQDVCPDEVGRLDQSCRPIEETGISDLREAIRVNRISFPSQVPTFLKHARPDLQRKLALLYFVLGWSYGKIGARYNLAPARVGQILSIWTRRAVETGYIQHIPPREWLSHLMLAAMENGGFIS